MRETSWSLAQYTLGDASPPTLGVLANGLVRRAPADWPLTALELLDHWADYVPAMEVLEPSSLDLVDGAVLTAPITYPRKLICAGANYYSHATEMGGLRPDPADPPFFFLKPPTTTIIGPNQPAPLPAGQDPNYDWEAELGIVIGRRGKHVRVEDALEHVAGYVVAIDLSARGRFRRPFAQSPFEVDWLGQKAQDGSCPLGPGIVPAWAFTDLEGPRIRLTVNGELMQDESLSDIVVGVPGLVSAASATLTLEPGDVILTGTPAGVGFPRNIFLAADDVIEASIDGIGSLQTPITAA